MARSRHASFGKCRKFFWLDVPLAIDSISGATSLFSGRLSSSGLAMRPFTVVRTIFHLNLRSDQAAAPEAQFGAFGLIVVKFQAAEVGATALPVPVTDAEAEWFAHRYVSANAVDLTDRTIPSVHFDIDQKAMRKVGINEDLVIMVENSLVTGLILQSAGRILCMAN